MKLEEAFERVVVINLPYRKDRRKTLAKNLVDCGMIGDPKKIHWERAISGDMSPPPAWWNAGNGAWGCLMSHLRVVQDAIMDGLGNYVVLEDDACTHDRAPAMMDNIMRAIQPDWDMLYLGGQNRKTPEDIGNGLLRGIRINRTHAFALNGRFFKGFQQHIMHAPDYIEYNERWKRGCHIDHQLERLHERRDRNIILPKWWLFGQEAGSSNVSGRRNPRFWWHPEIKENYIERPLVVVPTSIKPGDPLVARLHFGNTIGIGTLTDKGVDRALRSAAGMKIFLSMIARESLSHEAMPAIQCDDVEAVRRVWPNVVLPGDLQMEDWLPVPSWASVATDSLHSIANVFQDGGKVEEPSTSEEDRTTEKQESNAA